jgi:hypothetical protein
MTTLSRETVRDEIVTALSSAVAGSGKVFSSVYGYQKGKLDGESPVCLVLSAGIQRSIRGIGAQVYDNHIDLELQILVYDGDKSNPLTEQQREDKIDTCEAALAAWFVTHQSGTNYRVVDYTPEPSQITAIPYIDGNPYLLEKIKVTVEAPDK